MPAAVYRSVFAEDRRAELVQVAVAPEAGRVDMHLSARDDSSSLLPIGPAQNSFFSGTAEIGTQQVTVGRLADYLSRDAIEAPALLKLDVQGFELQALSACEDRLDRFSWIYVECSFIKLYADQALADSVIAWLRQRSFTLSGIHNVVYANSGQAIQADFLFQSNSP